MYLLCTWVVALVIGFSVLLSSVRVRSEAKKVLVLLYLYRGVGRFRLDVGLGRVGGWSVVWFG